MASGQTAKLERALAAGDHYGALQLYRTVIKRKIDARAFDEARCLLVAGTETLLRSGKAAEAFDLADMLLKALLIAHGLPLTEDVVTAVLGICSLAPPPSAGLGLRFVKAAIRWATKDAPIDPSPADDSAPGDGAASKSGASPAATQRHQKRTAQLHQAAAQLAVSGGPEFFADAQRHFLEADAPQAFAGEAMGFALQKKECTCPPPPPLPPPPLLVCIHADFLFAWTSAGYRTERDLFLARAVLQLLSLGNLRAANGVRDHFLSRAGAAVHETPLGNFLRFLLLTLEVCVCIPLCGLGYRSCLCRPCSATRDPSSMCFFPSTDRLSSVTQPSKNTSSQLVRHQWRGRSSNNQRTHYLCPECRPPLLWHPCSAKRHGVHDEQLDGHVWRRRRRWQ